MEEDYPKGLLEDLQDVGQRPNAVGQHEVDAVLPYVSLDEPVDMLVSALCLFGA